MLRGKRRCDFWSKGSICFAVEKARDVVDDGFKVIRRFVQLPDALVHTRLIVQRGYDESPIDRPSAPRRILKHTLRLIQIYNGLVKLLLGNALAPSPI